MRRALPLLALVLVLSACQPAARFARDLLDTGDGATLSYVTQGLAFDPDGRVALGAQLVATGENLALLMAPTGVTCEVIQSGTRLDCDLGDVTEIVTVNLTGLGVLANASYRREGDSVPKVVFAR